MRDLLFKLLFKVREVWHEDGTFTLVIQSRFGWPDLSKIAAENDGEVPQSAIHARWRLGPPL